MGKRESLSSHLSAERNDSSGRTRTGSSWRGRWGVCLGGGGVQFCNSGSKGLARCLPIVPEAITVTERQQKEGSIGHVPVLPPCGQSICCTLLWPQTQFEQVSWGQEDKFSSVLILEAGSVRYKPMTPAEGAVHPATRSTEGPVSLTQVQCPSTTSNCSKMDLWAAAVNALGQHRKAALLVGGAGAALLGLAVGYKYLQKPEKLVRVGVVSQLLVHPLKSGKALSVALAECLRTGLKFGELQDRHWMVVTEDGHMVTGRQEPRLVLMTLTCEGGRSSVWGRHSRSGLWKCCRFLAHSLSQGREDHRLVHFEPDMKARKPDSPFPKDEGVAYPDFAPVMLLSEASVKNLNTKLEKEVTVERFRPNIIISDCEPFEEDSWEEIQIGSVRLKRVMACGRCIFTTVDPETGVISRKEPLDTLKSFRLCDPSEKHLYKSSPLFGQLHTVKKTGILQVGDDVFKIVR
ncbi:hypothetical protein WMY93_017151 [Mugilogobius chulae]|uniref:MOSC domain-containing protein n=1 Tax=Mugilogobius chulae TaxID=88201 RepID=A0AAW0NRQ8_9GOBI